MSDEHDDKHHEHDKHHTKELNDLVRTLIEVQVTGNELLAGLNRKIDTTICILEHISKNTCETLNKLHELAECKETGVCEPRRPAEVCCAKPPAPPPDKPEGPCKPEKPEGPCKYEPCKPSEDGGGSDVSRPGSAPPQRTFGAPYPPAVSPDSPDSRSNSNPAPKIPRGPFRGFLAPGVAHAPLNFGSGGGGGAAGDDPVVFGVYTNSGGVAAPLSTVAADVSGAQSGNIVLATGNKYILYSFDGGGTFTTLTRRPFSTTRPTAASAAIRSCSMFPASTASSG
jgi:hypothetical protein